MSSGVEQHSILWSNFLAFRKFSLLDGSGLGICR